LAYQELFVILQANYNIRGCTTEIGSPVSFRNTQSMDNEKYSNYPLSISAILGLIEANDIAIPEIQRPFVWKKTQVRDLVDSLYKGYPTGYLILWKNPNVKLKDGTVSSGKKVLIDGQQRITALMTAVAGSMAKYNHGSGNESLSHFECFSNEELVM